jgi:quercetin dioxygenase-like cupin family protein
LIAIGDEAASFDLNLLANQLREQISKLPPDQPQLAKQVLTPQPWPPPAAQPGVQAAVMTVLLVVRGHENPHTHPNADLIFAVLEGSGWLQLTPDQNAYTIPLAPGNTVVVPKGTCHAFHNTSDTDSVLLATFSPADPSHKDGCAPTS